MSHPRRPTREAHVITVTALDRWLDLPAQRRDKILLAVQRDGRLRVTELARQLAVSPGTVRRDVREMVRQGLLTRVPGGALGITGIRATGGHGRPEPPSAAIAEARAVIVDFAASLVRPGTALAVTADAISDQLATRLLDIPRLTVVTNSLDVAALMSRHGRPDRTLVVTGGVSNRCGGLTGPVAEAAVQSLNIDQFFYPPYGMDSDKGFTASDAADAGIVRALFAVTRKTVVLADHGRWNKSGMAAVVPFHSASLLISDSGLSLAARQAIAGSVEEVLILPVR